jgi:hypothetical protein
MNDSTDRLRLYRNTSSKPVLIKLLFKAQEVDYSYFITKIECKDINDFFKLEFTTDLDVDEDSFHSTTKQCIYFDGDGYEFISPNYDSNFQILNERFTEKLELKKKREKALAKLTPEEIKLLGIQNV